MKEINHIVNQLKAELKEVGNDDLSTINCCETSLDLVRDVLQKLKQLVLKNGFNSIEQEVLFFKETKPFVMSRFLFLTFVIQYDNLYYISPKSAEEHVSKTITEKNNFLSAYKTYLLQIKTCTEQDEKMYFVRSQFSPPLCPISSEVLLNENFSTFHSEVLSIFESYDLIQKFLDQKENNTVMRNQPFNLNWTQNKTAMIELIYALHYSNAINNGHSSIKELKKVFESIFNVQLGNVYRAYHDFKKREVRTPFLENLKLAIENKFDEDDAFIPN